MNVSKFEEYNAEQMSSSPDFHFPLAVFQESVHTIRVLREVCREMLKKTFESALLELLVDNVALLI